MTFSDYIGTNSKGQDTKCILSYALSNFAVVDQFHIFHILIKNGTHHEALSEFYEEIQEALDAVAEHAVARYIEELSDPSAFYSFVWKNMSKYFTNESLIPLTIGLHQYMNSDVSARDKSIPLAAFGASVMSSDKIKFK